MGELVNGNHVNTVPASAVVGSNSRAAVLAEAIRPFPLGESHAARALLVHHTNHVDIGIGPGGIGIGIGRPVPRTWMPLTVMPVTPVPGYCVVNGYGQLYQVPCSAGFPILQPGFSIIMRPAPIILEPRYHRGHDWHRHRW